MRFGSLDPTPLRDSRRTFSGARSLAADYHVPCRFFTVALALPSHAVVGRTLRRLSNSHHSSLTAYAARPHTKHGGIFRSFIVSTIALTWPVPKAKLFVVRDVPPVSREIAVADVPPDGAARNAVFLNCRYASISKYLRASSFNVLSMIAVTWCLARANNFPVYGTEFPSGVNHTALYPCFLQVSLQLRTIS